MKYLKPRLTLGPILVSIISFFTLSIVYAAADVESALLQEAQEQANLHIIIINNKELGAGSIKDFGSKRTCFFRVR